MAVDQVGSSANAKTAASFADSGSVFDSLGFLATERIGAEPLVPHAPADGAAPAVIGPFAILKAHARGGLGEIFLAFDSTLGREVALKRIRPDRRGTAGLRERFLREAAITSQLEHPGIVPIYAQATDEEGRPYYVMRFIQGQTLAEAIAEHHRAPTSAGLRNLLQRFVSICQTAAYAHSKGVIHRDLKPPNVMLGPYGETLVLDWGLAKKIVLSPQSSVLSVDGAKTSASGLRTEDSGLPSLGSGSDDQTQIADLASGGQATPAGLSLTEDGTVLGTPAYMAPEQAAGQGEQVGPAADQFSLGAILYEILTGRPPHQARELPQLFADLLAGRIVPPRQRKPETARALEAVCLKALALRPVDRYASAAKLAQDVDRWLARDPVTAWPEPWTLRLGRWLRRHRTPAVAALALLFAVTIALGVGNVLLRQANEETLKERNAAIRAGEEQKAAREREQAERAKAEAAIQEAEAVAAFLEDELFSQANPRLGRPNVTLKQALDRALGAASRAFVGQPRIELRLRLAAGRGYAALSEHRAAMAQYARAQELAAAHYPPDDPIFLEVEFQISSAEMSFGRNAEALRLLEAMLPRAERLRGPGHVFTLNVKGRRAAVLADLHRFAEAELLFAAVSREWESDPETLRRSAHGYWIMRCNYAAMFANSGRWEQARLIAEPASAWFAQREGNLGYTRLRLQTFLGSVHIAQGRYAEAEAAVRPHLADLESLCGDASGLTADGHNTTAAALIRQGKFAEAEPITRRGLEIAQKVEEADGKILQAAKLNRFAVLTALGRLGEAAEAMKASKPARPRPTASRPAATRPATSKPSASRATAPIPSKPLK